MFLRGRQQRDGADFFQIDLDRVTGLIFVERYAGVRFIEILFFLFNGHEVIGIRFTCFVLFVDDCVFIHE